MRKTLFALIILGWSLQKGEAQEYGFPADKLALRYRIEFLDGKEWKPVEDTRKFKKNHTIRFRFMSNQAGTLHVLNASGEFASLHPVFARAEGKDLQRHLGAGTHIGANRVGLFPDPQQGETGLRFTGVEGMERFLFVFVPDALDQSRAVIGIPAGAEQWEYDHKTSYLASGDQGQALFHYFELKSR
jgi:hypothetical protein